jgi:hypothetical protein
MTHMRFRFDPHIVIAVALVPVAAIILAFGPHRPAAPEQKPQAYDYKPHPNLKPGGVPLRPMDNDIFAAIERGRLTRAQLLDLFPDRPYHVKLVADSAEHWVNTVVIDLDRNGRWDERWELKKEGVFRHTHGGPDDSDQIMFTMFGGFWIPH